MIIKRKATGMKENINAENLAFENDKFSSYSSNGFDYKIYDTLSPFIRSIFSDSIYIDIETDGLSASANHIISITLLIIENGEYTLYQTFSINDEEERQALIFLNEKIFEKKYIITYNGNSFDIPFINKRMLKYNIKSDLNSLISIDLYADMHYVKNKFKLDNIKLKSAEKYFNIFRKDKLSGKDVVKLYELYKLNKKIEFLNLILDHNFEDVIYLPLIFDKIILTEDLTVISKTFGLIKIWNENINISSKKIRIKASSISDYKLNYIKGLSSYKLNYKNDSKIIMIELLVKSYSDSKNNNMIYINNDEFNISKFLTLKNLNNNIIPLSINGTIIYKNIYSIVEKILNDI